MTETDMVTDKLTAEAVKSMKARYQAGALTHSDIQRLLAFVDGVLPASAPIKPTGQMCSECGNFNLVRSGTCMTCHDCGSTTGCG